MRRNWAGKWLPSSAIVIVLSVMSGSADALDGKRLEELTNLVRQDCGSCHGMTLKGGLGRPLLPENLAHADSTSITTIILDGVPGTPMPPWRDLLSREEARWIADRLKEGFPK